MPSLSLALLALSGVCLACGGAWAWEDPRTDPPPAPPRIFYTDQMVPDLEAKIAAAAVEVTCGPMRLALKDAIDKGTPFNRCASEVGLDLALRSMTGVGGEISQAMLDTAAFTPSDRVRIIAVTEAEERRLAEIAALAAAELARRQELQQRLDDIAAIRQERELAGLDPVRDAALIARRKAHAQQVAERARRWAGRKGIVLQSP